MELDGGNIKDLDTIFDSFKQDPDIKILLIDNASFGVGINIEYATDIIFFNKTEHAMKEQIIGRAQRFGRTNKLQVWELGYKNEFE
jgi:SNF2 family DNA or RNA helicase